MEYAQLIAELAGKVGLPELSPDADGATSLSVDGQELALVEKTDTGDLVLMAEAGDVPQEGRDQFFRKLLEKLGDREETNGAVYSVEPETKKVFLHQTAKLLLLDAEKLMAMLAAFAEVVRRTQMFATDFRASSSAETDQPTPVFGASDFIQV